jgi:hypothetical protein
MPVPAAASIDDEDDADDVAVPADDLEDIGAPAQVQRTGTGTVLSRRPDPATHAKGRLVTKWKQGENNKGEEKGGQ